MWSTLFLLRYECSSIVPLSASLCGSTITVSVWMLCGEYTWATRAASRSSAVTKLPKPMQPKKPKKVKIIVNVCRLECWFTNAPKRPQETHLANLLNIMNRFPSTTARTLLHFGTTVWRLAVQIRPELSSNIRGKHTQKKFLLIINNMRFCKECNNLLYPKENRYVNLSVCLKIVILNP